jgi:hypothetical protein
MAIESEKASINNVYPNLISKSIKQETTALFTVAAVSAIIAVVFA